MGKKLIILGADFSTNGMHTPSYAKLSEVQVTVMFANNYVSVGNISNIPSGATHVALKTSDCPITQNFKILVPAAQLATFIRLNGDKVALDASVSSYYGSNFILQTRETLTEEEQAAAANTHVTIEFYRYS